MSWLRVKKYTEKFKIILFIRITWEKKIRLWNFAFNKLDLLIKALIFNTVQIILIIISFYLFSFSAEEYTSTSENKEEIQDLAQRLTH